MFVFVLALSLNMTDGHDATPYFFFTFLLRA
jgi:hypothetical protein